MLESRDQRRHAPGEYREGAVRCVLPRLLIARSAAMHYGDYIREEIEREATERAARYSTLAHKLRFSAVGFIIGCLVSFFIRWFA